MWDSKSLGGLLNLDKPSGVTSRTVVNHVVRLLRKVKVGHAGTLDPLASGVLVVCVGSSTRLIESVQAMAKTYRVVIRLDATSDTLDADGEIVEFVAPLVPDIAAIQEALGRQTGTIVQRPPAFSALKIKGVRAYTLARTGQQVDLAPRTVTIHRIAILSYRWPLLELEIHCEGGTYIRSIARDLGEALGCGGLVEVLIRTQIGPFSLETAIAPAELTAESLIDHLRPALEAVPTLPRILLSQEQVAEIVLGRMIRVSSLSIFESKRSSVALLDPSGKLIALGEIAPSLDRIQPRKVLIDA